jgi:high-affinity nickel-transport protein
MHLHAHDERPHLHLHSHVETADHGHGHAAVDARRSLGFGIAHGLAGSGAIAVLLVAAAPTAALRVTYFAAFGVGTVLGMLMVSLTLGVLVRVASQRGTAWATALHLASAVVSVVAGLALAWGVMQA